MPYRFSDAAVVREKDLIAVVTNFSPLARPSDYYSEVEFLSAFEIRALAPIYLAKKPDTGAMALYPLSQDYRELGEADLDLSNADVLRPLVGRFRRYIDESQPIGRNPHPLRDRSYDFNQYCELDRRRLRKLVLSIHVTDHLVIRGLGALLKAGMLNCHPEFSEQACMSLWIALDAGFRIVLRILRGLGYMNPTAKDAGTFLDDAFDSKYASDGFFEDFYEERIKTMHPENRFGVYPGAPLCADEYFQLNQSLGHLYDFLLTGHVYRDLKGR